MDNRHLHFLAGLPRSGSTVLTRILNQHPDAFATTTSPFLDYVLPAVEHLKRIQREHSSGHHIRTQRILQSAAFSFYDTTASHIIDKNRGWLPNRLAIQADLLPDPRIVVTLRPIEQVVASFYRVLNLENGGTESPEQIFVGRVSEIYLAMKAVADQREHLCLVTYHQLVNQPQETMARIESYLGMDHHTYDFGNIQDPDPEDDSKWGIAGLHTIRPQLADTSIQPQDIMTRTELKFCQQLTQELYDAYAIPVQ